MEAEARFERIERILEFLANGQAEFDSRLNRISQKLEAVAGELDTTVRVQQGQHDLLDLLLAAQKKTEQKMNELIEQGKNTDHRLDALIQVVDGLIPKRPN